MRPDGQEYAVLNYGSSYVYGVDFNKQELAAFQRDDLCRETTRMLANGLMQSSTYNDAGQLM